MQRYRLHLKHSKLIHFHEAVQAAKGNMKQLYETTLGLVGKHHTNSLPESPSDELLANYFTDYFINKIEAVWDSLRDVPSISQAVMLLNTCPTLSH